MEWYEWIFFSLTIIGGWICGSWIWRMNDRLKEAEYSINNLKRHHLEKSSSISNLYSFFNDISDEMLDETKVKEIVKETVIKFLKEEKPPVKTKVIKKRH
jgi:hypothetical protein